MSARILVPVDPDFPSPDGKCLRVSTGMELAFRDASPVVILKGVSINGIPNPNAWLGGLKNIDLMSEFGDEQGCRLVLLKGLITSGLLREREDQAYKVVGTLNQQLSPTRLVSNLM
ncbi:MAG: hypothetical protein JAY84_04135 [Candidatus Thiodiazotropha taylori]|nr:hypothetical protein [Candidatus Thiodiazotropha taylori]